MQPWKIILPRLAKLFLDYEPGIHYSQLQMQAGTSGINTIRIYNPVLNGKEKDSGGSFIREYLPELYGVPKEYLHEPWKSEEYSELDYPKPVIDILEANKIARKVLWEIKGNTSPELKAKIFQKHGSRVFRSKKVKVLKDKTLSESLGEISIIKLKAKMKKGCNSLQMSLF